MLLNNANGTFVAFSTYSTGSLSYPRSAAISDVNKDGYPDVVAVGGSNTVAVLLNRNTSTFNPVAVYSAGASSEPVGVAVGDLNGDSYPDIVTANRQTKSVGLLRNQTPDTFATTTTISLGTSLGSYPDDVALADLNDDGKLDIITANGSANSIGVLLNTTTPLAALVPALAQVQTTLAPNPTTGTALFTATGLLAKVRQLSTTFTDVAGRTVSRLVLPVAQGIVQLQLPTAALAPGCYLLQLVALDAQNATVGTLPVHRVSVW